MRFLHVLALLFFAFGIHAQHEKRTIKWKDGKESDYRLLSNEVPDYTRWNLTGGILLAYNASQFLPGISLDGNYEYLDDFKISAGANFGFPIEFDYALDEEPDYIKPHKQRFQHYNISGSMRIHQFSRNMTYRTALMRTLPSGYLTVAPLEEELKAEHSFHAIVGYDYLQARISRDQRTLQSATPDVDSATGISYLGMGAITHNIRVGLRYRFRTYFAYELDDQAKRIFDDSEAYAVLLVPVGSSLSAIRVAAESAEPAAEGYQNMDFSPLGFLVGMGTVKSGKLLQLRFTLEGGMLPGPVEEHNLYFGLKFGLGIGQRNFLE